MPYSVPLGPRSPEHSSTLPGQHLLGQQGTEPPLDAIKLQLPSVSVATWVTAGSAAIPQSPWARLLPAWGFSQSGFPPRS